MKKIIKIKKTLTITVSAFVFVACTTGEVDQFIIKTDPNYYDSFEKSKPQPPASQPAVGLGKTLPQELIDVAKANNIPGVQIAYLKGDSLESYTYGVADINTNVPITEDHLFEAASISKAVATYAFLRLYDKGIFDLDVPLNQYYIYDRVARANNSKNDLITARHVLAHQTGYPNWMPAGAEHKLEPLSNLSPGDYNYSGEGFTYLQEVLKHLTGKSLQEIVYEEVFQPFGMISSSYQWESSFVGRHTRGHVTEGNSYRGTNSVGMFSFTKNSANSAFSLITNAKDLMKFVKRGLMLGEGLKSETYNLIKTTATWSNGVNNPNMSRGLGLVIHTNEKGWSLYHSGANTGYRAFCIAYPELEEGLVVLTNRNQPEGTNMRDAAFPYFLGSNYTYYMF